MRKWIFLVLLLFPTAGLAQPAGGGRMMEAVFSDAVIRSATAVTEVFGDGQKLTAIILEYRRPVRTSGLATSSFAVPSRTILRVYATNRPQLMATGRDGRYVVLQLDPSDEAAPTFDSRSSGHRPATAYVRQTGQIVAADGSIMPPTSLPIATSRQTNLVVDDFVQGRFVDPSTGLLLNYNLYIPKNYQPGRRHPLVLFMPDLGATSPNPLATLVQGNGATAWASPRAQAENEAFVLAPQYSTQIANDASQTSDYLDVTVNLLRALQREYTIDPDRLYATGQSGGCMMAIAMNIRHPDLFAASFLVAGQWDPALVAPMARNRLFILVSQDDAGAWPGMNAVTAALERNGASVRRATWDGTWNDAKFDSAVADLLRQGGNVHYAAFRAETVIPPGQSAAGASGHRNTWRIAYSIEAIQQWMFAQRR